MSFLSFRRLAVVGVLVAALSVRAAEPLTDIHGDALPPGAVARFGTIRLRHAAGAIAFAPDGKTFATGGSDFMIRQWNAVDGREIRVFKGHTGIIQAVAFSADGKKLYSASQDGTLREWDAAEAKELHSITVGQPGVVITAIVAHPTEPLLLTADAGSVREWDLKEGKEKRSVAVKAAGVGLALHPDGKAFALFKDNAVSMRDLDDKEVRSFPIPGSNLRVLNLTFSADGNTLGGGCSDQAAVFWDVATGQQISRVPNLSPLVGTLTLGANGRYCAVKVGGLSVRIIGVRSGQELRQFGVTNGFGGLLGIAPTGKRLAYCQGQSILLWDLESAHPIGDHAPHGAAITAVRFSPDGKRVTSLGDGRVTWWDPATSKAVASWTGQPMAFPRLTPDGRTFFTSTINGLTRFDLVDGKAVDKVLVRDQGPYFQCLAVSPDQKVLAVRGNDQLIHFRSSEDGTDLGRLARRESRFPACYAFAPNGKQFANGDIGALYFWDVPSAGQARYIEVAREIRGAGGDMVTGLEYSPDGWSLLTVCAQGVSLWETHAGHVRWHVQPSGGTITSIVFSPDGRLAAVGTATGSITILDTATGSAIGELAGHRAGVRGLDFSFDGALLASGSEDGTVLVWDMADLNRKVRPALVNLTEEQLAALGRDLVDGDSAKAYKAVRLLANSPQGVAYLQPKEDANAARVKKLIVQLDDDEFEVRDKAHKELEGMGTAVFPLLRNVLRNQPSPEVKAHIIQILGPSKDQESPTELLRSQRTMEALEFAGTADALKALKALASGDVKDSLVQEAKAALARLERRAAKP